MQPTRVYAEALGYCEIPAPHTYSSSLFRHKDREGEAAIALTMAYREVIITSFFLL